MACKGLPMLKWFKRANETQQKEAKEAADLGPASSDINKQSDLGDADAATLRRVHFVFRGQVQGVGFRWNARNCANDLGLCGWIRNEWDGSVTMELQGNSERIARFFTLFNQQYRHFQIDYVIDEKEDIPLRQDESEFKVIF